MDVIVVQSESAVKLLTLELVLLETLVRANVADYATVGIVMRDLLFRAVLVHDHTVVSHIILDVVVPAIDHAICIE